MKNCIKIRNGSNGGHGGNALNRPLNGENSLDLLPSKKSIWTVEMPGFFRKKRLKIKAESIILTNAGDLLITEDATKGRYAGISSGSWIRFYIDK